MPLLNLCPYFPNVGFEGCLQGTSLCLLKQQAQMSLTFQWGKRNLNEFRRTINLQNHPHQHLMNAVNQRISEHEWNDWTIRIYEVASKAGFYQLPNTLTAF